MASCKPCFVLSSAQILSRIDEFSDILETCVNDGASVSFMLPFSGDKSRPFWMSVAQSVDRGERIVLGTQNAQGCLSVPSSSLSINPKTNLIVLMSLSCWFTPQRGVVGLPGR